MITPPPPFMLPNKGKSPSKYSESQPDIDSGCHESILVVDNIHCASCIAYITAIFSDVAAVRHLDVCILSHEVRVSHGAAIDAAELACILIEAAFEVHRVTTYNSRGTVVSSIDTTVWISRNSWCAGDGVSSSASSSSPQRRRKSELHLANCDACKKESGRDVPVSPRPSSKASLSLQDQTKQPSDGHPVLNGGHSPPLEKRPRVNEISQPENQSRASITIGGMSCAACANGITDGVKRLEFVTDVSVNFLSHNAIVTWSGPESNGHNVVELIEEMGFEAALDQVTREAVPSKATTYVAELAIGGLTCGSCVGALTQGLEELQFVADISVSLLSHTARMQFHGRENIDRIVAKIEEMGYDASVSRVFPQAEEGDDGNSSTTAAADEFRTGTKTVSVLVDGMFCDHCPAKVLASLYDIPNLKVVDATLSLKNPIIKVAYIPRPPSITIRGILKVIESSHTAFQATVYRPPTNEERSRAMQQRARRRLLTRLFFVAAIAIPTFVIGMVCMNFAPSKSSIRRYLEQPVWFGNISRVDLALFILSTPVMFYGADIFHTRAVREICALWRPGSPAPLAQRFYRFGSMNLLISAGTTVAYMSSCAALIANAVLRTETIAHRSTCFDSVVFLTLFILGGRCLESYSKGRTDDAVASLGKLRPSEADLVESSSPANGAEVSGPPSRTQRISVDLLEIGDVVSVSHGSSPPADGTVASPGTFRFDESSLTGEATPVKKSDGDPVYAGSVNIGPPLRIQLTGVGGSSMLDQIIAVVREGQSKRASLERAADTLTAHFVPVITLIAIVTFVVWLSLGLSGVLSADYLDVPDMGWTFWSLEFAIAVFVVACPCGLALAAPTALFVGGGVAARRGILVKGGGEAFQEASRLDAVIFDKTGTLTDSSSLQVSDYEVLAGDAEQLCVGWAVAQRLEENSNHPIAKAIREFCQTKGAGGASVNVVSSDMHEIPGHGMQGSFMLSTDGAGDESTRTTTKYEAAIGNDRLLRQLASYSGDSYYLSGLLSKYQGAGKSIAILSLRKCSSLDDDDNERSSEKCSSFSPVAVFAISESIRPGTAQVVSSLLNRNIDVFMCTGDNQVTAHAIADTLGIPRHNVMADVLPTEKARFVHEVQRGMPQLSTTVVRRRPSQRGDNASSIVAFVGDGVNDAPALAAADVSIAMSSGSDVALSSASFILLNSELHTVLRLVLLSRRVFRRVKLNFGWALIYNLILVPIAAGVMYPIVVGQTERVIDGEAVLVDKHWRLSPVWAALAMALSSISVVCSSLALGVEEKYAERVF